MMNLKPLILGISMSLALTAPVFADTILIAEPKVRTIVTTAGYSEPILVEQEGELWRVKSIDTDSENEVTLFVDQQGKILSPSEVVETRMTKTTTTTTTTETETLPQPLDRSGVTTVVMNAGFHNVHDIDFLDSRGLWKAEADDITGEDFELHVNPETGMIVHIEDD
jgi:hypothetical protein